MSPENRSVRGEYFFEMVEISHLIIFCYVLCLIKIALTLWFQETIKIINCQVFINPYQEVDEMV